MRNHAHRQKLFQKIRFALVAISLLLGSIPGSGLAATPTQDWVARYSGPGQEVDLATALAVDATGNVYVTGYSTGSGTSLDYATVKYDANGNQLWEARYNAPGNGADSATALAVDAAGNVYVTGRSTDSGSLSSDYATVKYDANGNQLWVARYSGNSWDSATALAVDAAGNVYVTGWSSGSGTLDNGYATVKYDANGNQLWVARYNGPGGAASALAVDAAGDVYVTGTSYDSGTSNDYATVKYDANGNQLWVARYNGPGNGFDNATALAVDATGDVYVTGYSPDSGTNYDYATIKYDTNGNELWLARYNGPGNYVDYAIALAVDATGNVHVMGYSTGSGTNLDYATVKYDTNGNQLWAARYNGPGNFEDLASALAVDAAGNVYVTGYTGTSVFGGTLKDYATVKYDANGNQLWEARYNGPGNGGDGATALAVDTAGNVYVTGWSSGSSTNLDYATIKYSQSALPDTTPPVISVSQTPLANTSGWNNTDVTVSFTATDAVSTPSCTVNSVTLTAEGAGQVVSTTCTDAAGNSATASHTVNLDKTKPVVSGVSDSPDPFQPGSGQSTTIQFTLSDNLSGTCKVKVGILNSSGVLVNTLTRSASCPTAGATGSMVWDGRDSAGTIVPKGIYRYQVQGSDQALNNSAIQRGNVSVR